MPITSVCSAGNMAASEASASALGTRGGAEEDIGGFGAEEEERKVEAERRPGFFSPLSLTFPVLS